MSLALSYTSNNSMKKSFSILRVGAIAAVLIGLAGLVAWRQGLFQPFAFYRNSNSLIVILPYQDGGAWVFDDPATGLKCELFIAGLPAVINHLVRDIPGATNGFRMLFSAQPFPGYQKKLTWLRPQGGGNIYRMEDPPMEGWWGPELFRYYREAPKELYVKVEPRTWREAPMGSPGGKGFPSRAGGL